MYDTPIGICCDTLCRNVRGCVLHLVLPTRIRTSPESSVPNNESTSCLINVRGEEQCCILGVAHQHSAWGDTATESPWVNRGKAIAETRQWVSCTSIRNVRKSRRNDVWIRSPNVAVCVSSVPTTMRGPAETVSRSWRQSDSSSKSKWSNSRRRLKPGGTLIVQTHNLETHRTSSRKYNKRLSKRFFHALTDCYRSEHQGGQGS